MQRSKLKSIPLEISVDYFISTQANLFLMAQYSTDRALKMFFFFFQYFIKIPSSIRWQTNRLRKIPNSKTEKKKNNNEADPSQLDDVFERYWINFRKQKKKNAYNVHIKLRIESCSCLMRLAFSISADCSTDGQIYFGSPVNLFCFQFYRNDTFVRNVNKFWHRFRCWVFFRCSRLVQIYVFFNLFFDIVFAFSVATTN